MNAYYLILIAALAGFIAGSWFEACVLHDEPKPRPAKRRPHVKRHIVALTLAAVACFAIVGAANASTIYATANGGTVEGDPLAGHSSEYDIPGNHFVMSLDSASAATPYALVMTTVLAQDGVDVMTSRWFFVGLVWQPGMPSPEIVTENHGTDSTTVVHHFGAVPWGAKVDLKVTVSKRHGLVAWENGKAVDSATGFTAPSINGDGQLQDGGTTAQWSMKKVSR